MLRAVTSAHPRRLLCPRWQLASRRACSGPPLGWCRSYSSSKEPGTGELSTDAAVEAAVENFGTRLESVLASTFERLSRASSGSRPLQVAGSAAAATAGLPPVTAGAATPDALEACLRAGFHALGCGTVAVLDRCRLGERGVAAELPDGTWVQAWIGSGGSVLWVLPSVPALSQLLRSSAATGDASAQSAVLIALLQFGVGRSESFFLNDGSPDRLNVGYKFGPLHPEVLASPAVLAAQLEAIVTNVEQRARILALECQTARLLAGTSESNSVSPSIISKTTVFSTHPSGVPSDVAGSVKKDGEVPQWQHSGSSVSASSSVAADARVGGDKVWAAAARLEVPDGASEAPSKEEPRPSMTAGQPNSRASGSSATGPAAGPAARATGDRAPSRVARAPSQQEERRPAAAAAPTAEGDSREELPWEHAAPAASTVPAAAARAPASGREAQSSSPATSAGSRASRAEGVHAAAARLVAAERAPAAGGAAQSSSPATSAGSRASRAAAPAAGRVVAETGLAAGWEAQSSSQASGTGSRAPRTEAALSAHGVQAPAAARAAQGSIAAAGAEARPTAASGVGAFDEAARRMADAWFQRVEGGYLEPHAAAIFEAETQIQPFRISMQDTPQRRMGMDFVQRSGLDFAHLVAHEEAYVAAAAARGFDLSIEAHPKGHRKLTFVHRSSGGEAAPAVPLAAPAAAPEEVATAAASVGAAPAVASTTSEMSPALAEDVASAAASDRAKPAVASMASETSPAAAEVKRPLSSATAALRRQLSGLPPGC